MILQQHRMRLFKAQAPGLAKGLMLPSNVGTYRTPNSLDTDGRVEVRSFRFPKRARTIDRPMSRCMALGRSSAQVAGRR